MKNKTQTNSELQIPSNKLTQQKEYFIAFGIYTIIIAFVFNKLLLGKFLFLGADSLSPKAINIGLDLAKEQQGFYPLWLQWVFGGMPSLHSFQHISRFYLPHHIFDFMRNLGIPWIWNYIFHFSFAGMGMFVLLKRLKTDFWSALIGGVAFILTPYLVTMVVHGHGSQMMTSAFIPWILWALIELKETPSLMNMGKLALFLGLQLQRAHVQIAYYTWLMVGLFLLIFIIQNYRQKESFNLKSLWLSFGAMVLSIGMAMWIYLPSINYTSLSQRGGTGGGAGIEYATQWSFSFGEMMTFIFPSFFGFGGATYWGSMPMTDYPNYMGIIVLILAIIGIFKTKGFVKIGLLLTIVFALILSFGKHLFVYELFYNYFPMFSKFRVPAMFLILVQFAIAVFAGLGFSQLLSLIKHKEFTKISIIISAISLSILLFQKSLINWISYPNGQMDQMFNNIREAMLKTDIMAFFIIIIIFVTSLLLFRFNKIKYQHFGMIIFVLIIADLWIVDRKVVEPKIVSNYGSEVESSIKSIKRNYKIPRNYPLLGQNQTLQNSKIRDKYITTDSVIDYLKKDDNVFRIYPLGAFNDNRWSAFHIESISGYHPAKMQNIQALMKNVGFNQAILKMLNVKYIVSDQNNLGKPIFSGQLNGKDAFVYQFPNEIGRVYFASHIRQIDNSTQQFNTLKEPSFNPTNHSFVSQKITEQDFDISTPNYKILSRNTDGMKIEVYAESPQFMVLSEIYYPKGWIAKLDENEIPIYEVNTLLRGMEIPAGKHIVEMLFEPNDVKLGTYISWVSMLFILSLFVISKRGKNESL